MKLWPDPLHGIKIFSVALLELVMGLAELDFTQKDYHLAYTTLSLYDLISPLDDM